MRLSLPWCSPLQVRSVKACPCRFRSTPSWSARSWTQLRLKRKPEAIWAGSFLACIGGSLRFSDAQHVLWSSLCISHFTLRGICYRTKTTKRAAPFAFLGFGAHSASREFGMNWLSAWILHLDSVWQELRSSFGAQVTPDCLFFTMGKQGFSPASYAQTLLRLRNFLQESGIPQAQALGYTLHSMKVTMLSWMAQLDLPLPARTLQGHHALAGSMQLYSRDDIWPALRAQFSVWEAIQQGFTPMLPQHRGGQNPLQESMPILSGFAWTRRTSSTSCFVLTSDAQSFLAWQASQKSGDTSLAASGLSLSSEPGIQLPKPLCRAPRFEDSDGDLGPEPEHDLTDQDCPAGVPAWKSDGPAETSTVAETAAPSKATPACADVRFLLSSSGIAHLSIFHSGSRMLCLACRSDFCTFRCQPACGCFSDFTTASVLPPGARLCRRRACVIASAGDCSKTHVFGPLAPLHAVFLCVEQIPHFATCLHALTISARDPTLSLFSILAIMSKTPLSADYIHKLLKTIPESEREKFLVMLATQPIIEQQPASGSSGAPASDPPPQPSASTPQTLDEFCDTVAQEAYAQPASPAVCLHPRRTPQRPHRRATPLPLPQSPLGPLLPSLLWRRSSCQPSPRGLPLLTQLMPVRPSLSPRRRPRLPAEP